jgi:hypothetical protein
MSSQGDPPCSIRLTSLEDTPAAIATAAWEVPRATCGADLVAEIGEQAQAAARPAGCMRLGHRHILTGHAHQPINCAATIGP